MLDKTAMIIIDYYSIDKSIEYIEHFKKVFKKLPKEIILVDNSGAMTFFNEAAKKLEGKFKLIESKREFLKFDIDNTLLSFISSKENKGFARGNNFAVEFLIKKADNVIEYLLFSNNDIYLETEKKIDWNMVEKLFAEKSDMAILGFEQVDLNGSSQNSGKKRDIWVDHIFPFLLKKQLRRGFKELTDQPIFKQAEWVSGAFFIAKKNVFEEAGGFDPKTFLYYEEPILAARVRKEKKQVYFANMYRVIHEDGFTTKKQNSRLSEYHYESIVQYFENYTNCKFGLFIYKLLFLISKMKKRIL